LFVNGDRALLPDTITALSNITGATERAVIHTVDDNISEQRRSELAAAAGLQNQ